jgi:transcriptional regulator with XRE-family HTH domain
MIEATASIGDQLRGWRQLRRMSQLDLALDADISARHLSFVETGRSQPSREMILRLAERLAVPLRNRNAMFLAAGLAPAYRERSFDDPELRQARAAVEQILRGHEPFPALAVDRHWTMLAHNAAVLPLLEGVAPGLLEPPVNVLRLSLHPEGLAPRILNLGEWKAHLLERLRAQFATSADPLLGELARELERYPAPRFQASMDRHAGLFVPLVLDAGGTQLSFFSTTTMFGTPVDITLSEIAVEAFFPADGATAEALRGFLKG